MIVNEPKLKKMMCEILDNCCSNPEDWDQYQKETNNGRQGRNYTGWNIYEVHTHCAVWRIIAKKVDDKWIIREAEAKDC